MGIFLRSPVRKLQTELLFVFRQTRNSDHSNDIYANVALHLKKKDV